MARTNADGSFVLTDVAPADYGLEVARTSFVTAYKRIRLRAGEGIHDFDVLLVPAGVIAGVVTDEDKEPVRGVEVQILWPAYLPGAILQLSQLDRVITDDRGSFRTGGLAPGDYYLRTGALIEPPVNHIGQSLPLEESSDHGRQYRETWFPEAAAQDGSTPLNLEVGAVLNVGTLQVATEPTWSIKGHLEGYGYAGLKEVEVSCVRDQPFEETFGSSGPAIEPDGSFVVNGVAAGDYTLSANSLDGGVQKTIGFADVHVSDKNVVANIQVGQAGRVRGTVVAENGNDRELRDARVSIEAVTADRIYVSDIDSQHAFDIQSVPPGAYTFGLLPKAGDKIHAYPHAISCSGVDYLNQPLVLTLNGSVSDCEMVLSHDTGTVSGTVKGSEHDLTVALVPQSRELHRIPRYTLTAHTDATGHYEIEWVIPGSYFLFVVKPDREQRWFALSFADAHQSSAVSVTIPAGQHVSSDLVF